MRCSKILYVSVVNQSDAESLVVTLFRLSKDKQRAKNLIACMNLIVYVLFHQHVTFRSDTFDWIVVCLCCFVSNESAQAKVAFFRIPAKSNFRTLDNGTYKQYVVDEREDEKSFNKNVNE